MKILIGLSLLQTIAIIVLIVIATGNSGSVQQQSAGAPIVLPQRQPLQNESSDQSPGSLDEQRLRSIIREELVSQQQAVNRGQDAAAAKSGIPDAQAAAQMRNQTQLVAQKIEGYKGVGAVSDRQMQELLGEIDQLDEQSRAQMMSSLARAINTGALKGRL